MKYNTSSLPNGLRIIHLPAASPVVYCGYEINAGAASEACGEDGLAHFCEHTTFKGTTRRTSLDIINCLETVGGDLNAFTTKTDTVYYAAIMKEHLPRAVDLLTDIVFHSTYPQKEIDREVEVICDEIESYNDSPAELIYDEFENIIFKGSPLGHNILGTAAGVRTFKTADALRFTNKFYRPDNAIFFAYGDIDFNELTTLLEACTPKAKPQRAHGEEREGVATECKGGGECLRENRHTHQAHVMMGNRAYGVHDERRMALYLLNNILGGPGMNARLNLNLRERHGLVYTVESTMVSYAKTGIWSVYFGCDKKDVDECLTRVRHELDKVMDSKLSDEELAAAKQQIKGQIGIACDNRENFALDFGKAFLHYGWEKDITSLFRHIDELTSEQIQEVAQEIFQENRMTTLIFE